MTMYQAEILICDMAKLNDNGIDFIGKNAVMKHFIGDCLRFYKINGGYETVMQNWKGYQEITVKQIRIIWGMVGALLKNCAVETD